MKAAVDQWDAPAAAVRGFLILIGSPARLPREGKRLIVSAPREGGGLVSYRIERRPGSSPASYSVLQVRNVEIDAVLPA